MTKHSTITDGVRSETSNRKLQKHYTTDGENAEAVP